MTIRNTAAIARIAVGPAAVLAIAIVSGCSSAPPARESTVTWDAEAGAYEIEPEIASGEVPLQVWVEYPEYGEALVEAFTAKHPGIRVELTTVSKVDAVAKMELDGEAGTGADVYFTNFTDLSGAIDSGVAAPLGEYETEIASRVGDAFAGVVSRDGELYGVPVSTESIALFYNKTLLQQLTGSSEPAQTWEQIRELAASYNDPPYQPLDHPLAERPAVLRVPGSQLARVAARPRPRRSGPRRARPHRGSGVLRRPP